MYSIMVVYTIFIQRKIIIFNITLINVTYSASGFATATPGGRNLDTQSGHPDVMFSLPTMRR